MNTKMCQVIAFYLGNPHRDDAKDLWGNIAVKYPQDMMNDPHFY